MGGAAVGVSGAVPGEERVGYVDVLQVSERRYFASFVESLWFRSVVWTNTCLAVNGVSVPVGCLPPLF